MNTQHHGQGVGSATMAGVGHHGGQIELGRLR